MYFFINPSLLRITQPYIPEVFTGKNSLQVSYGDVNLGTGAGQSQSSQKKSYLTTEQSHFTPAPRQLSVINKSPQLRHSHTKQTVGGAEMRPVARRARSHTLTADTRGAHRDTCARCGGPGHCRRRARRAHPPSPPPTQPHSPTAPPPSPAAHAPPTIAAIFTSALWHWNSIFDWEPCGTPSSGRLWMTNRTFQSRSHPRISTSSDPCMILNLLVISH